ncbi:MAG: pantothenate synthetase [Ignavibacteriaceae bacterium]|nr:MAG: pantothenate synthetase [Ignavibacteriaceae bacterium]
MQSISRELKKEGKTIGFVPTMGYLHEGHLSLVRFSRQENDITVVSIFVNPTQFSPNEDLSKYPRDINRDENLLVLEGVDYLFYPTPEEIYPGHFQTYVVQERISTILEGEFRPTHFRGVTTVVAILFNIVLPDRSYFGRKDAQQCAVLNRMVQDLRFPLEMKVCPIVREKDGLAMSSRNVYLDHVERGEALVLSRSLNYINESIEAGERDAEAICQAARKMFIDVRSASLDYLTIVAFDDFEPVEKLESGKEYFALVACRIGKTRLIDNLLVKV